MQSQNATVSRRPTSRTPNPLALRSSTSPTFDCSHEWKNPDYAVLRSEAHECQCTHNVVVLLEEVENQMHKFNPAAIDATLACHKGALQICTSILRCRDCATSIELLIFVAKKLSQLCEKVVTQLSQQSQRLQISHSRHQEMQGWFFVSEERKRADVPPQNLFLGIYEIDSLIEWVPSMKGLITVQLKGLSGLAAQMKARTQELSDSQVAKLGHLEKEIRKMMGRL